MKRMVITVEDEIQPDQVKIALYNAGLNWYMVLFVKEEHKRSDGTSRMTTYQRDKLWDMCGDYNVPFHEDHYHPSMFSSSSPVIFEGWIGGEPGTIYVGVEPDGRSHT